MQINAFDVHLFWLVPFYIGGVCVFCWPSEKNESENKNKTKINRICIIDSTYIFCYQKKALKKKKILLLLPSVKVVNTVY